HRVDPAHSLAPRDPDAPFGIYLHVPFCSTRCGYCDFNTYTAGELGSATSPVDRKSTRLNSSHVSISYAVFCLKKKKIRISPHPTLSSDFYIVFTRCPPSLSSLFPSTTLFRSPPGRPGTLAGPAGPGRAVRDLPPRPVLLDPLRLLRLQHLHRRGAGLGHLAG